MDPSIVCHFHPERGAPPKIGKGPRANNEDVMSPAFDWNSLGEDMWRLVFRHLAISVRLQEDMTGVNRLVHVSPLLPAVCRAFRAVYNSQCCVRAIRIEIEPETVVGDGLHCDAWQTLLRAVMRRRCHRLEVWAPEGNPGTKTLAESPCRVPVAVRSFPADVFV